MELTIAKDADSVSKGFTALSRSCETESGSVSFEFEDVQLG